MRNFGIVFVDADVATADSEDESIQQRLGKRERQHGLNRGVEKVGRRRRTPRVIPVHGYVRSRLEGLRVLVVELRGVRFKTCETGCASTGEERVVYGRRNVSHGCSAGDNGIERDDVERKWIDAGSGRSERGSRGAIAE